MLSNDRCLQWVLPIYKVRRSNHSDIIRRLGALGSFIDFYLFCTQRWDDPGMSEDHYMLRFVKSTRNAAAHSSNIVNGFVV